MRKNSCLFKLCKQNLLGRDRSTLTRQEKQHIQRYHEEATVTLGLKGVIFCFWRDSSDHRPYVCECGSEHSCSASLSVHVVGSEKMKRVGCPTIYERARDVDQTKSIYQPDKKPYKAWPSDFKLPPVFDSGNKFERSSSLSVTTDDSHFEPIATNETDIVSDADSDVEMIVDAGPYKEATDHDDGIPSGSTHHSDWQQLLDENYQALQEAIDRLRKAQANIETLRKRGQVG